MNKRILALGGTLVAGVALGLAIALVVGDDETPVAATEEKKVLYWQAPMDPSYRSDEPGKSPMGMDLVPVYEGGESGADDGPPALRINPAVTNNLGVRTAPVERSTLHRRIETVGFIAPNEERLSHVHVRVDGWIEKLLVKAVGERVEKGDLLFQMYSPTLVNAQSEYLQALRLNQKNLADAARERLRALGMAAGQITALGEHGRIDQLTDVRAPQDGSVLELGVAEGMYIEPNTTVFSIADLSSVWVMVEIFEDQIPWLATGQEAVMRLAAAPGRTWEGVVDYVYPTVDPQSRTVRVRLVFDNPDAILKPDMYATVRFQSRAKPNVLSIPREALIRTGEAERVILALGEGRFRPAKVVAGVEASDRVEIVSGLEAGETVVTSAQFLIDSEASLDASLLRLSTDAEAARPAHGGAGEME